VSVLSPEQAEALEALIDERVGALPAGAVAVELAEGLESAGLLDPAQRGTVLRTLEQRAAARVVEWGARTTTQGDVLAAFAVHCRDELDDVDVVAVEATRLEVRWRTEQSRFELRNGFLGLDRLASSTPTMLLGDLGPDLDGLVSVFLDRADLRTRLVVCDLDRLERLGTVRSSAFVYFEWFLRDTYHVKVLPSPVFTQGLIDRGIISLGMG
jgi:hypothetical protein